VDVPADAEYLSFDYRFPAIGDGDYAAVFIDDVVLWVVGGGSVAEPGTFAETGLLPLGRLTGRRRLTVALYGVGEKNASFEITGLRTRRVGGDADEDAVIDDDDNCSQANPDQADVDGNGVGDACQECVVPSTCLDDGDPCTVARCIQGACAHEPIVGLEGLDCELAALLAADVCGKQPVHVKLARPLKRGVARARGWIAKLRGEPPAKRRARLVAKIGRVLNALQRKLQAKQVMRRVPESCLARIARGLTDGQALVAGLRP
jgi:hypothetical protein